MRNHFIELCCISCVTFFAYSFASCSSDDFDKTYSCNKTTDIWVKENLSLIRKMERKDWLKANASRSRAIYRAFTVDQKKNFWNDKFSEVEKLSWRPEELAHIKKAESFVKEHEYLFSGDKLTDEQLNEVDMFFYKWQQYAIEKLGWNKKQCIAIAGSGNKMKNKNGDIVALQSTSIKDQKDCNCNTGMLSDFCGSTGPCIETPCSSADYGCGWVLVQSCNGECDQFALPLKPKQ